MATSSATPMDKLSEGWQRLTEAVKSPFSRSSQENDSQPPEPSKTHTLWLWAGGLFVFAILFSSWLWWQERDYQALYGRNESYDTAAVIECLERENIPYRLHPDSGQVLVHGGQVSSARIALAQSGIVIPVKGRAARSDKGSSLGVSHFTERNRHIQALEEELSRTVQGIDAVRTARVHLAVPEQSSFLRDTPGARASVSVDIYQGQMLSRAMIKGIIEIVAGSVAGMDSSAVAVVDQSGRLLSAEVTDTDERSAITSQQLGVKSQVERHLEGQVAKLLEAISGPGRYRVDVAVDIDFSQQESAWEDYGPDEGVLRSESVSAGGKQQVSDVAQATGSSAAGATDGPLIRNYEVNRQVNKVMRVPGRLLYLSVAVLLDYRVNDEGINVPWPEAELANLQALVEQAVGARDERADRITVQSMPFYHAVEADHPLSGSLLDMPPMDQTIYFLGAVILVLVLLLALSIARGRRYKALRLQAQSAIKPETDEEDAFKLGERPQPSLSGEQFESRKRTLMAYAANDPDRVAMVLKKWMQGDNS